MPESPAPGVARAVLNYNVNNQDARNVLHFEKIAGGAFDSVDVAALAAALSAWWTSDLKPNQPSVVTLESIITQALDTVPGIPYELGVGGQGTNSGVIAPGNVTPCITYRSSLGGRSGRGRSYHVGMIAGQLTGDVIAASFVTILKNAYGRLSDAYGSDFSTAFRLTVLSRYANKVQRPSAIHNAVTAVTVDNIVDSQRRRLTGRGR